MSRHSRGIKAITSSSESSSSDDDDAFGRRQRKLKLSLEALEPVSTSVERAPPHHRSRAALEVAELLLQAYLEAKKEVKAEIERLAFSFYVSRGSTVKSPSPFSPSCSSSLPPCLAARSRLERAAASSLPEARRKSFLRAVRDASIAEKRGGKAAAAGGGGGDAEAAATASASASADEDADGSNSLALSSELFELVPDVIRHVANFLAPVDALAAACVCRTWRQALDDVPFWRQKLSLYFGGERGPGPALLAFEGALRAAATTAEERQRSGFSSSSSSSAAAAVVVSAASCALRPEFERGQGFWIAKQLPREERKGEKKKKKEKTAAAEEEEKKKENKRVGFSWGESALLRYWVARPPPPPLLRHHPLSTRYEADDEGEEGDVGPRLADRGPREFVRSLLLGGPAPVSSSSSSSSNSEDDGGDDDNKEKDPATAASATSALRLWNLSGNN